MTEMNSEKYSKKTQTESNLYITSNDINIVLSKEFLEELQLNTYHGWIDEDMINHIAMMGHQEIHKFCDGILKRVLEGLKIYNNDVKHGYVASSLSKEDVEYLRLFEEEIEEQLKHHDQMRRWEMYVNGRPLGLRRQRLV
nr:hypothetical protein [Tanacetum cinerariifolium]